MFHTRRYLRSQALETGAVHGGAVLVSLAQGEPRKFEQKAKMAQNEVKSQGWRYCHHSARGSSCSMATWKDRRSLKG